jgi:hypothetical protein
VIHEKIKRRLNSDNAYYHSVQKLLYFRLPSDNIKIRIHITIILPVILFWREIWSLTLREEVFHNLNSLSGVIRTIKPRAINWAGHIARIGRKELYVGFFGKAKRKERDN